MRLAVQHVECFHLVLLRMLESRLDRASRVVKGGVNLRAWFGSVRYSEDLVVDALSGSRHVLTERVDKLLAARAFHDMLAAQGLTLARATRPKQTDTTQRRKSELHAAGAELPLQTRLEFSRRGCIEDHAPEPVRAEVVRPYGLLAPTVQHDTGPPLAGGPVPSTGAAGDPRNPADLGADAGPRRGTPLRVPGVRLTAATALGRLRRMGKAVLTTRDAALFLGLSLSAASRALARLADAGLVCRCVVACGASTWRSTASGWPSTSPRRCRPTCRCNRPSSSTA